MKLSFVLFGVMTILAAAKAQEAPEQHEVESSEIFFEVFFFSIEVILNFVCDEFFSNQKN